MTNPTRGNESTGTPTSGTLGGAKRAQTPESKAPIDYATTEYLGAGAASQIGVEKAGSSRGVLTETPKTLGMNIHIPVTRTMTDEDRAARDAERTDSSGMANSATHLTDNPEDVPAFRPGLGEPGAGSSGTTGGTGGAAGVTAGGSVASLGAGSSVGTAGAGGAGTSGTSGTSGT